MGRKLKSQVIYELIAYQEAAHEINQIYFGTLKQKKNFDEKNAKYVPLIRQMSELMGKVEKLEVKDTTTTYVISSPWHESNPIQMLDTVGLLTGEADSGKPYKSVIIKQLFDHKVDIGIVEGQHYKDGKILEMLPLDDFDMCLKSSPEFQKIQRYKKQKNNL